MLAVGALVASILAVGATPAAATTRKPDFEAQWKACLGPALADRGFTDVSETTHGSHYDSINCLAYYGITTGRTADTFAPGSNVTRSQMALFLNRAADAAGIDLGEATDRGFTDLNADDTERFDAINRLVGAEIMFGDTESFDDPPSETVFAPTNYVTRWEMAMFLFAFLDHALDEVLVDVWPRSVDGDSADRVELGSKDGGRTGTRPDDYFRDALRKTPTHVNDRISAIYELGITTGTNNMIGEDGTFDPNGLVTRASMASFIMRTMGHTNLRPAGLTAQSTNDDTQVSLRDADFVPIVGERTEVITTNFPDDAFNANGACIDRYVRNQDPGFGECEIDVGDRLTSPASDDEGNALWLGVGFDAGNQLTILCTAPASMAPTYTFMAPSTRGGDTDYTIFAWTGGVGDEANKDDLFKSAPANVLTTLNDAVKAVVTGGVDPRADTGDAGIHAPMGASVTYTVQLRDAKGRPVGPSPNQYGEMPTFEVQIDTYTELEHPDGGDHPGFISGQTRDHDDDEETPDVLVGTYDDDATEDVVEAFDADDFRRHRDTYEPDASGRFTFTISSRDRQRHENNPDTVKRVFIRRDDPENHSLRIVDMTMPMGTVPTNTARGAVQLHDVRFSDNDATARRVESEAAKWRLRGPRNRNSIAVSVQDQYGNLYRVGDHEVHASDLVTTDDFPGAIPGPFGADATPEVAANTDPTLRGGYSVGTSGRRSIGYTHNADGPLEQTVTFQLRTPGTLGALDDPDTTDEDETRASVVPVNVTTGTTEVTIYWAMRGSVHNNTVGEPILWGDPASNELIVNEAADGDDVLPIAYPYGADDKFVVEGEVVNIDQFEEILAQHPYMLIPDLGMLSWVGFDFNRPRDGATWSIDGLSCLTPGAGD